MHSIFVILEILVRPILPYVPLAYHEAESSSFPLDYYFLAPSHLKVIIALAEAMKFDLNDFLIFL